MKSKMSYAVLKSLRRLTVLNSHLTAQTRACSDSTRRAQDPCITVTPSTGMVDEKVKILIRGLNAEQKVTVVANVVENGMKFESRSIHKADSNGEIDNSSNESLDGTFKGVDPMGLFWSLKCVSTSRQSARLVKKNVCTPMDFSLKVYPDAQKENPISCQPILETKVQRLYKKPGVKRIPLTGKFKGTIFVPEGEGPFPGLIDMFGGVVSIIETRAALLASHGYATMALSYLYQDGLPDNLMGADFNYVKDAYEWFTEQDYVDKNRLGAVGLCFGGFLCLGLASRLPQFSLLEEFLLVVDFSLPAEFIDNMMEYEAIIRAVVNINGISITPEANMITGVSSNWLDKDKVFKTDEGIVITDVYDCNNPFPLPAWQHGAKILVIVGEDDKQVHPKWHTFFYENCPARFKQNIQVHRYPGAGHMIEPPYSPHTRVLSPGRKRMSTIDFIPEKFYEENLMAGGWPAQHSHAQEDSWKKVLAFLENNVKNVS